MRLSWVGLGAAVSVLTLGGCNAEPAAEARAGAGEAAGAGSQRATMSRVRACNILDLEAATRVIGVGTEHPGGDTEEFTCMYSNAGVAVLTLQLGTAELYDQITILPPHTAVQIGSRGRYNVQETGTVAVQFVKGAYSVTLSVQPIGRPQAHYLESLLTAAREVADHLP